MLDDEIQKIETEGVREIEHLQNSIEVQRTQHIDTVQKVKEEHEAYLAK